MIGGIAVGSIAVGSIADEQERSIVTAVMSTEPKSRLRPRRSQEERSQATRAALLDATIDCLVEYGYAGVTTSRVAERAGVSRGAEMHHFPTKAALVSEALTRLAHRRAAEMRRQLESLPAGALRGDLVLDLLWATHLGPLFEAALELWVASRTDVELRAALFEAEREVNDEIWTTAEAIFGEAAANPDFRRNVETALAAMRGLALLEALIPGDGGGSRWAAVRSRLLTLFEPA